MLACACAPVYIYITCMAHVSLSLICWKRELLHDRVARDTLEREKKTQTYLVTERMQQHGRHFFCVSQRNTPKRRVIKGDEYRAHYKRALRACLISCLRHSIQFITRRNAGVTQKNGRGRRSEACTHDDDSAALILNLWSGISSLRCCFFVWRAAQH